MSAEAADNPTLAYARGLHEELVAANKDLYSRAQAALTLDGLVITVFGTVVSASPDDVAKTAAQLGPLPGAFWPRRTGRTVGVSHLRFFALFVRYMSGRPRPSKGPVGPSHLWFYARIAEIDPDAFVAAAAQVTDKAQIEIRLRQVAVMAPIMRSRARWVNRAYPAAALGFLSFVAAAVSYLLQLSAG